MLDLFDTLMNARCSIWRKGGSGNIDSYGHESQAFTLLKEDIPCRVDPGAGKELQTEAAFGIQQYVIFMRPQFVDNPQIPLNIHHWLQVNKTTGLDGTLQALIDPPSDSGAMLNITNITNPALLNHHLEVSATLVEP